VESIARMIALVLGIATVLLTAWSVFTALVVPRVTSSPAMRMLARVIGGSARRVAPKLPNYEARDRVLSFVGPAAMVLLFVLWLCFIVLGVALIEWYASGLDFATALGISGSSVFTLGIVSSGHAGPRVVEVAAAGIGLLVVALEIAYLPTLYTQFSTRETEVTLLEARAGNPAWGPEILARHFWLDTMDELPPLYADWERWASAVSESHANYPGLIWFRSPVSTRSWLVALVAMMDSAALYHATSPTQTPRQARLCLSMGINCLRSMARALHIPYDDDPLPTAAVRLTRPEFDEGFRRLEAVNFPAERSADDAWRNFQGWRVNYEPIVDALTAIIVPPPAPWFPARPELGAARLPLVLNRTPDEPEGTQVFGASKTFKTPSARESNNS
jgi:hypothetical protein